MEEFKSKFIYESDYFGPFAMIIAQQFPAVPDGVDPEDPEVLY